MGLLYPYLYTLTFKNRASHNIGRAYRYPPDVAFYMYFFNKYKY